MSYLVHLQKFEGPMGLLLYLIRKEEMDIFDINVSELTKQYLDHIRMMRELDLEVAGEFVSMAATLLQIKSRMLLPQYGEDGEPIENPEDPRQELVQKLLEHQRFQEAGKKLIERPLLTRDVWVRGQREGYLGGDDGEAEIILDEDGLFGLIASYRRAVRRLKKSVHEVRAKGQSIAGRILEIKDRLIVGLRVAMSELVSEGPERRKQILITFLSMLELGRMGFVSLFQNEPYGEIYVETKRAVERNVLERVQEFDSSGEGPNAAALALAIADGSSALPAQASFDFEERAEELERASAAAAAGAELAGRSEEADVEAASDDEIFLAEAELMEAERAEGEAV